MQVLEASRNGIRVIVVDDRDRVTRGWRKAIELLRVERHVIADGDCAGDLKLIVIRCVFSRSQAADFDLECRVIRECKISSNV